MTKGAVMQPGRPNPLGATPLEGGTNFALFSENATGVDLCLFASDGKREVARHALPERTGNIWHGFLPSVTDGQLYGYRVHGPYGPKEGHRFNANKLLIDPYAKRLSGTFGDRRVLLGYDPGHTEKDLSFCTLDSASHMPKCVVGAPAFRWGKDTPPDTPMANTIFYEAHVKGLTRLHMGVPAKARGTFEGLAAPKMLDHLVKLGVSAVELLPIQSFFPEPRLTDMGLTNYWGYNPINYFVPEPAYMGPSGEQSFQKMVRALHTAGIEVILDVVYNHTAESWELGPTLSYRGIDNASYYRLQPDAPRFYVNDTGCGNSLRTDHPMVMRMVMDSLRHWVTDMHVDGFRFDLAPTMARTQEGFCTDAPLIAAMQQDPVLAGVKLIMEPWDVGPHGYQLGSFPAGIAEWNDRYRDQVRSYWRGHKGAKADLAGGLLGSADIFDARHRKPQDSVNFITSHDGFNLTDLVSYSYKRNEANGEQNRDGHGHNISDNCGHEGATDDAAILARRTRRKRNLLATLILSQGTPMLLAGDEIGHSQQGNNNAYCQDNEITWLDWAGTDADLTDFVAGLIRLRKTNALLRQEKYLHDANEVEWLDAGGGPLEGSAWHSDTSHFGCLLKGQSEALLMMMNADATDVDFRLPGGDWACVLNTGSETPFKETHTDSQAISLKGESVMLLKGSPHA